MTSKPIVDDDGYDPDYDVTEIVCYDCDSGWKHSCCSDMCMSCYDAQDYLYGGRPCRHCNPHGDIL